MKVIALISVLPCLIILTAFQKDSTPEWETELMGRIVRDQKLPLTAYLLDLNVLIDQGSMESTDTLILYLAPYPNRDSTSDEILEWSLRCTFASNTGSFVAQKYNGACKPHGVVVPSEIKLGNYLAASQKVEILCSGERFTTLSVSDMK